VSLKNGSKARKSLLAKHAHYAVAVNQKANHSATAHMAKLSSTAPKLQPKKHMINKQKSWMDQL